MVKRITLNPENLPLVQEMLRDVDNDLSDHITSWTTEEIVINRRAGIEIISMWQLVMWDLPEKLLKVLGMDVIPPHLMNINGYCNELYRRYKRIKESKKYDNK